MKRRRVNLSESQRAELLETRDHHRLPHLRDKAAAILKVADGALLKDVAAHGLNRAYSRTSISRWIERYEAQGLDGLHIEQGRGRKPAFSPCPPRRRKRRRRTSRLALPQSPAL